MKYKNRYTDKAKQNAYMNGWDIEGSEYDPDDFCIEILEIE